MNNDTTDRDSFSRFEYSEAKAFLADAVSLFRYSDPIVVCTRWQKPDGTTWIENESRLEPPEWDYSLWREVQQ